MAMPGRPRAALFADADTFKDYLLSFGIFADAEEGRHYVDAHHRRFLHTVARIPSGRGALLEIGAAPFGMTLMMEGLLDYDIQLVNYGSEGDVHLHSTRYEREIVFPCCGSNVECESLPFEDGRFDVVLCAEVIEHLTFDPAHMLCELHRVLKPGGRLVVTTPNALRLLYRYDSARLLARGRNPHDAYSGYGPYGRHNREYTPEELRRLVDGCGFAIASVEVEDVDPYPQGRRDRLYEWGLGLLFGVSRRDVRRGRGAQITLVAQPERERRAFRPDFLYKSVHAVERARAAFPRIP